MTTRRPRRRRSGWLAGAFALPGLMLTVAVSDAEPPGQDTVEAVPGGPGPVGMSTAGDPPEGTVALAFAGDVHFEGGVADLLDRPDATLGPLSRTLREADVAVVNLESALTDGGVRTTKELEDPARRFWFRSPPEALDVLDRSGVDVVSLANNHGADYGEQGLRDSLRADRSSPVSVIGVGGQRRALMPYRVRVGAIDVAVLAADASPRESAHRVWGVGERGLGIASARESPPRPLLAAVRSAASNADVVAVYLHWGKEYDSCPTSRQQGLASRLARAGADVVVGSHAHVLLGAGMLGRTYVSYGLGGFLWYHGARPETGVLRLTVAGDGTVVDDTWVPGLIRPEGGPPRPLTGAAAAAAVRDWRALRGCTRLQPVAGFETDEPAPRDQEDDDRAPADRPPHGLPAYQATVREIWPSLQRRMTGRSHDPATCPVALTDLRHLTLSYVDFAGRSRRGKLVVHADHAQDLVGVFRELYQARWPIRRMEPVDRYGGNDDRSMAADNSSAYNCRRVAGQERWSDHAFGAAVDLNPMENPYVLPSGVLPPAARAFAEVDRSTGAAAAPGVIRQGDVVTRAFARIGWTWGGTWRDPDYQHFSAP